MNVLYYTIIDTVSTEIKFYEFLEMLPHVMRIKAQKFINKDDAYRNIYGKLLLSRMIEDFDINVTLDDLKYTEFQKPYFDVHNFHFNISHSGNMVVCFGSNQFSLGVDIEEIVPIEIQHFKSMFHPEELDYILKSHRKFNSFYDFWTKKEAIIKADGRGLNAPLQDLCLRPESDNVNLNGTLWYLQGIELRKDYKCAIASSSLVSDLVILRLSF